MVPRKYTLRQRRLQVVVKNMEHFPVKFMTHDYNITKEEAAIIKEFREEYNIKSFKTVMSADKKTTFIITCCKSRIDRNTLFNSKSDWFIYNKRKLTELLKPQTKNKNYAKKFGK